MGNFLAQKVAAIKSKIRKKLKAQTSLPNKAKSIKSMTLSFVCHPLGVNPIKFYNLEQIYKLVLEREEIVKKVSYGNPVRLDSNIDSKSSNNTLVYLFGITKLPYTQKRLENRLYVTVRTSSGGLF